MALVTVRLLLFSFCFCFGAGDFGDEKKVIRVGGLFHHDNLETEMAFRYAIERANFQYGTRAVIEPTIEKIDPKDSYKAEKVACAMTDLGVAAIFGPQSVETRGIVESICEAMEIPHIQTTWVPNPPPLDRMGKMGVKFYPNQQNLSFALSALVSDYDWKTYTILYEDDSGLVRLQEIFKKHGPKDPPISVYQLTPKSDNRPLLKKVQNSKETHIILDCEAENILDYLRQAHEVNLLGDYQTYILTSLDAHTIDLEELNSSESNITSFRMVDPTLRSLVSLRTVVNDWIYGEGKRGLEINANESRVLVETALMIDAVNHFLIALNDLMATDDIEPQSISCADPTVWNGGLGLANFLKQKSYNGLTGYIRFNETGERSGFALDVVELHKGIYYKIGSWDTHYGFSYTRSKEDMKNVLFEKLKNKTFIVSSRTGEPYLIEKTEEGLEGNDRYEGYSMDLIKGVAEILNISFRFEIAPDNGYGSYDANLKRWNGLVGQLLERKADFAICDLTITYDRKKVVDFTMPFMTLGISILFTKPTKEPPDLFSFLQPFSLDVWIFMATAYLGVSILLFVLARMAPKEWANPHPCDPEPEELENILTLLNSMWLALGSFLQQGSDILPKATSTRMVAGMWWFFTLIMISSYTANLAAFLTNERMDAPIKSAEDLVKQNKIKYGTLEGGSTYNFFKNSNHTTYSRIFSQMESTRPSVFVDSNKKGIDRVINGKRQYAYFMESTTIEFYAAKNCELMKIGGELDTKGYGIAMPINSPMRTYINDAILKMQESGKLMELKKKWWVDLNGAGKCNDDKTEESASSAAELGIDNVGGVFVVLGFGCFIALIIGIVEFLWNVRQIAVEDKVTMKEAFMTELMFAINLSKTEKPIKKNSESAHSSRSGSREREPSQARSMLNAATSFMGLDKVF